MTKISDYILEFIARKRVKHVFLVTGGGAMYLNDSLARGGWNRAGLQCP